MGATVREEGGRERKIVGKLFMSKKGVGRGGKS